jgi:muramidase (phage lysozyme)
MGMGGDNSNLRKQVETRPLYPKKTLGDELDAVLKGQPISPETKAIIRRTGLKPSEYFIKQSGVHGTTLPSSVIEKLQAIDGSKLVSSADTTGGMGTTGLGMVDPSQTSRIAQAMWTRFAPMFSNAVTPPTAAATMPVGTMGPVRLGTPVVGTPKLNANAKAWLAAISAGGFEGAGYNTYYGGGAFDNTKGHPMRVVRPAGGIASSAAGRYQFMPDTWTGLHNGKNPPMTPANQDAGAYQLALNRGVDLNTAPPTIENVRKLAPVWAALPVNATGGAGYYKGQGGAGFARFRQTWNTELSRYSGK